ncbi:G/U mismatch-specific DNA glycosylase [Longimicrobium sp.]|uniref:G/U mismatch-specific DNA glycosylase n=1 Tax=Longimicrobium sp. TaxID=2029185 RepID=UPI003B3A4D01
MKKPRPTKEELLAAGGRTLPDVIAPGLRVLFCGINPGLYTAAVGHHFARPGNRFWKALHEGGFTPRLLDPSEEQLLLEYGCGITNVADRPSTAADELPRAELIEGGRNLEDKVRRFHPRWLAVLGLGAYRTAFAHPKAVIGPQEESLGGARVWVLPNPSGLNANYKPADFGRLFGELRRAAWEDPHPLA